MICNPYVLKEYEKLIIQKEWEPITTKSFCRWRVFPFGKDSFLSIDIQKSNRFYRWTTRLLLGFYWVKLDEPVKGWY